MRTFSSGPLALALLLALAAAGCDSGGDTPGGTATADGTVTNSFGLPLQGAEVTMTPAASGERSAAGRASLTAVSCTTTTNASGQFSCPGLPAGSYTVTITVPGYGAQTFNATVSGDGSVTLSIPPVTGQGTINATLINALTGAALAGASVECRRQLPDGTYGPVEFTATASPTGQISLTGVFTGEAQCTATAGGLTIPLQISVTPTTTGTVAATPPPPAGQYRVVLTWGETPSDLDSHLTGPDDSGSRFHVYYANRSFGDNNLDTDDTSAFGPETVTIVPGNAAGTYRYSVFNYSDQSGGGAAGIHTGAAKVRLYNSSGLLATFEAPAPSADNGGLDANTWRVFEITIGNGSPLIAGSTPGGIGYRRASGSGDVGTFLTGGPAPTVEKARVAL